MKKILSICLAITLLIGCMPLAVFADNATVTEFDYAGDEVNFIKIDGSQFGMFTPQEGTTILNDGTNVIVHYVPKNKTVYNAFYYGPITNPDQTNKVSFNSDGSFDFALPNTNCGKAIPITPVKKKDGSTTSDQYYLAIPDSSKIPFTFSGDELSFVKSDGISGFGMFTAQTGTEYSIDGEFLDIHFVPKNKTVYGGIHFGLISDDELIKNVEMNDDGTFDITLTKDKCGIAWPIAPVKKNDAAATTKEQYFLAIPKESKIQVTTGPAIRFNIKFVNEDGTELQTVKAKENTNPTYTGPTPKKAATSTVTYTFKGWDTQIEPATADKTYTATYTASDIEYTIKFVNEDGTELQTVTTVVGQTPAYTGETPTKAEDENYTYTFKGWEPELVAATADATYKAVYDQTEKSSAGGNGGNASGTETPADATVDLKVTNEVKMFKVNEAQLVTKDGVTSLVVTLNGSGYHYLYKGTYEDAKKTGYKPEKWIEGKLNSDGKYVFTIPVDENESYIPIVSISQTYVDKYNAGENKIERAFFPRQFTLNAEKKTLLVENYEHTQTLKLSNKTDLDISNASLTTLGGPNSNEYASTLSLTMKSGTYTKAYIGTAKKAAGAKDTVDASGKTFELKLRWMETAGDLDSIVSHIGEDETFAFYNAEEKVWEEFTFNINDSKYTLTVTADEESEAVPAEEVPQEGETAKTAFIDVKESDWYDSYAEKAAELDLMTGYAAGVDADGNPVYEFRGSNKVTRAMFVTILSAINKKLNGDTAEAPSAGFADVEAGAWYEKAVNWAYANGITAGRATGFGVNDNVSRQDMAVFMYAYAKSIGKVTGTPDTSVLDKYEDASSIAPYAKEAMAWLVSSGLMTGRSDTSIAPLEESTRAEISAFAVSSYDFLSK